MDKPFIGAMNRKITIIEKAIIRTSTGSEKTTEETICEPYAAMKDNSGSEDIEGKVIHLINRSYTIRANADVKSKGTKLIVIDDFFDNPDDVREFALSCEYKSDNNYYKGLRSVENYHFPNAKELFESLSLEVFKKVTSNKVKGEMNVKEVIEGNLCREINDYVMLEIRTAHTYIDKFNTKNRKKYAAFYTTNTNTIIENIT